MTIPFRWVELIAIIVFYMVETAPEVKQSQEFLNDTRLDSSVSVDNSIAVHTNLDFYKEVDDRST